MQTTPRPKSMKKSVSENFWETYPQPFCSCQYLLWSVSEGTPTPSLDFIYTFWKLSDIILFLALAMKWFGILVSMHDKVLFLTVH